MLKISRAVKRNPNNRKKVNKKKRSSLLHLPPRTLRIKAFQRSNPNNLFHKNPTPKSYNNNVKTSENDLTMILQ